MSNQYSNTYSMHTLLQCSKNSNANMHQCCLIVFTSQVPCFVVLYTCSLVSPVIVDEDLADSGIITAHSAYGIA